MRLSNFEAVPLVVQYHHLCAMDGPSINLHYAVSNLLNIKIVKLGQFDSVSLPISLLRLSWSAALSIQFNFKKRTVHSHKLDIR